MSNPVALSREMDQGDLFAHLVMSSGVRCEESAILTPFLFLNSHLALMGGGRLWPVLCLKIALLTRQTKSHALKRPFRH